MAIPYLIKEKPDIIIPVNGGWQSLICKIITRLFHKRLVFIGHAGIGADDRWNLILKPDLFIALTEKAQNWARKKGKGVRIVHIPNGINLSIFNPYVKQIKLPFKGPVIMTSGAFTPNKRIDLVIKAVSKYKEASLLILGDGPFKNELKILAMRLLGKKRYMLKKVLFGEMPFYYKSCSVFTLPSIEEEAFGNVYLEAMACNIPVVAPDYDNRREIIGKAGIYCNCEDPDDYALSLKKAIDRDFKNVPFLQAQEFSIEETAKKYEEILKNFTL